MEREGVMLRDVFAVQGILVVGFLILLCVLHLTAPELCRGMLQVWQQTAAESPGIEEWREWFVSVLGI